MTIKKLIITIAVLFAIAFPCTTQAQLEKIYSIDSIEKLLRQEKFDIDSSTDAVILYQKQSASLLYEKYVRAWEIDVEVAIKVFTNNAQDLGEISLISSPSAPVKDIYFESFNLVNGQATKVSSTKKDIINERVVGKIRRAKFQIPNVALGSIIYYRYSFKSPYIGYQFGVTPLSWKFRSLYPTLHTRFEITTREDVKLECASVKSFQSVTSDKRLYDLESSYLKQQKRMEKGYDKFIERKEIYAKNNVLPSKEEPFARPQEDDILEFLDLSTHISSTLGKSTWQAENLRLVNEVNEGLQVSKLFADSLKSLLKEIAANDDDTLSVAKAIYRYVRDSIETEYYLMPSNLSHTFQTKKGTAVEKVLLTSWLLNAYDIKAIVVITADNETQPLKPDSYDPLQAVKTVVATVVNGEVYFLDPSSKHPFGILPPESYNGFAWGIAEKGIPVDLSRDMLKNKNSYEINLVPSLNDTFNFDMSFNYKVGVLDAMQIRRYIKSDSGKVKEELISSFGDLGYRVRNVNIEIENPSDVDAQLIFAAKLQIEVPLQGDIEHISPSLMGNFKENPFKNLTRINPIDFDSRIEETYNFYMKLPKSYEIDEVPPSASIDMPDRSMSFNINTTNDGHSIVYKSEFKINKTTFDSKQYDTIKRYFAAIVDAQNQKVTLKRIGNY